MRGTLGGAGSSTWLGWVFGLSGILLLASCVVTDVEGATGSGGSGTGGSGTGAIGTGAAGNNNTGGSSEPPGGSGTGGSGQGGGPDLKVPGIECGNDTCTNEDVCCVLGGTPVCITEEDCLTQSTTMNSSLTIIMKCDDSIECSGKPCCVTGDSVVRVYDCSDDLTCQLYESCSSTTDCTSSGDDCVPAPDGNGFRCVDANASVACDNATCSGASPVCCASPSPACVAYGDTCSSDFGCDGGSDCDGQLCCATSTGSSCMGECQQDPYILCDAIGDCPTQPAPAMDCAINANVGPAPGYKVCEY